MVTDIPPCKRSGSAASSQRSLSGGQARGGALAQPLPHHLLLPIFSLFSTPQALAAAAALHLRFAYF
jgi:hypothetical protein